MGFERLDWSELSKDQTVIFRTKADPGRRYECRPLEVESRSGLEDDSGIIPDRPKFSLTQVEADDTRRRPLAAEAFGELAVGQLFSVNLLDRGARGKLTFPGEVQDIEIDDQAAEL